MISAQQKELISEILDDHSDILADGMGEVGSSPKFDDKELWFNGIGDDSHETFGVVFGMMDRGFCKTARKEYDVAVCKAILVLSLSDGFTYSSDGDIAEGEEGWADAKAWFKSKTGKRVA